MADTETDEKEQLNLFPGHDLAYEDIEVDLDRLPANEHIIGPNPTQAFVESVKQMGVFTPIMIERLPGSEEFILRAGGRRVKAARLAKRTSIPARVIMSKGFTNPAMITAVENALREDNLPSMLSAIRSMRSKGHAEGAIKDALGMRTKEFEGYTRLLAMSPELLNGVMNGRIKRTVADRIARLDGAQQAQLAIRLDEQGKITHNDLRLLDDQTSAAKPKQPKQPNLLGDESTKDAEPLSALDHLYRAYDAMIAVPNPAGDQLAAMRLIEKSIEYLTKSPIGTGT